MTAPEPKQLPLWGYRTVTIDPGSDQQKVYHIRDDESFRINHPTEDRVVVMIGPREE